MHLGGFAELHKIERQPQFAASLGENSLIETDATDVDVLAL